MLHLYVAVIVISLSVVILLESLLPLHQGTAVPLKRWWRNLTLSALALSVSTASSVLFWASARTFGVVPGQGLLANLGLPVWAQWIAAFLILDGAAYGLHRLSHAAPWLWRLHAVHHSDPELDATTTHRHHPAENLVVALATLPLLLLLAPPVWAVLAYGLSAVVVSTFSHGNLALPHWFDRALRNFIVTPAFHRTHHSAYQPQTDSNYATVFPLFDLVFRSTSPADADKGLALTIGLETSRDQASQSLLSLLAAPFRGQAKGSTPSTSRLGS